MFYEADFRKMCGLLKEFDKKYHRCPHKKEVFREERLGEWVIRTRSKIKRGEYGTVQIEILHEYKIYELIIKAPSKKRTTNYFREQVVLLKAFKIKYNRLPMKRETFKDVPLGVWCNTQKYNFNRGELTKEQISLLASTGLLETGIYNFKQRVKEVDTFYKKYNRFPLYNEVINRKALGYWWYCIRDRIWKYTLSEDDFTYIQQTAPYMIEYGRKKDLRSYWSWLSLLEEFQKETGRVYPRAREEYQGEKLGSWCSRQRMRYKKGELTANQKEELEALHLFEDMVEAEKGAYNNVNDNEGENKK